MPEPYRAVLKAHPESIGQARSCIAAAFAQWELDDYIARLVVSELATNAITHACGDSIVVRVERNGDGSVTVEAWDNEPGSAPLLRSPNLEASSGRGLRLIENLVREWGWRPLPNKAGKVVYAVLEASE
ncbi:ATP-binding protein [Actinomadura parmotrematis]|uniref:ATP-binding protein n=1 Tax=Actinomadura parmotrematis TaxID=2864039 RepID=A0ABS7G5Z1_9ACTN|nr:ATP-binding protein [Actinomadura parmotrematis]MBW8487299.1 ATP-binding protein [Actinomadura parmotrematis]